MAYGEGFLPAFAGCGLARWRRDAPNPRGAAESGRGPVASRASGNGTLGERELGGGCSGGCGCMKRSALPLMAMAWS